MRLRPIVCLFVAMLTLACAGVRGDGLADNVPQSVRRIPKEGIPIPENVRKELEDGLGEIDAELNPIPLKQRPADYADIHVLQKAVRDAIKYQEFFTPQEFDKARSLLKLAKERAADAAHALYPWRDEKGLVVRGYVSKIDGSVQPYSLVIPEGPVPPGGYRLDVWFHGRGEVLSEVNFLDEHRTRAGEFTPPGTIVLHPYGRYCNAFKFAGEVDVLEAIDAVTKAYPIDPDRISVRGFSMGGAGCWQFAVHYSDRWFAANPGAGFAETPRFLNVFQKENLNPTWYEKALWHLYDCTDYAVNLSQCPTVAYSGELDIQKQAADVMAEALAKEGITLTHIIGPQTKHQFHPEARVEIERRLASLAASGRKRFPEEVKLTTYTLKYNRMNWVTIDALGEHWKKAEVAARQTGEGIAVRTGNVDALTLEFPSGFAPFPLTEPVNVTIDGATIPTQRPESDRSWKASFARDSTGWKLVTASEGGLRKRHDLQGPIDDAFMDSFYFVKPTGESPNAKAKEWSAAEMDRAIEHWRRHFRGEARVVRDDRLSDAEIASSNLVLWGDPFSNRTLARIADKLPIRWTEKQIEVGRKTYDAAHHGLILIYPNPLNPARYVVLNSGFTFREYDYLNNARQVPKLPDWAVIDLRTPPDSRFPGKVVAADFFGERWELRPEHEGE